MKKIFIGGCPFGSENIGDDAIIGSMVNSFEKNHQLTIAAKSGKNQDYIEKYLANKSKNLQVFFNEFYSNPIMGMIINSKRTPLMAFFNNQKNKNRLKGNDLFICGGGTLITDMPAHLIKMLMHARRQAIPTVIFGVGMAEIKYKNLTNQLVKELNHLQDIYVRDEFVKIKLNKIGVADEKIKICHDPAICLQPNTSFDIQQYLSTEQINHYNNGNVNIGITLSSEKDVKDRTAINKVSTLINHLTKIYNANVFLIPTNYRNDEDYKFMLPLCANPNTWIVKAKFNPEDFIAFMQNFQLVISSRLHMNILCSITGTPFIGLIRNSKIIDYSAIHSLHAYTLDELNEQTFYSYINTMIEQNAIIRKTITNKVQTLRTIHQKSVASIIYQYL